jgi:putative hydrolase
MRLRRGGRRYRVLFSNTSQAHRLGRTCDWVVIYSSQDGKTQQWTVMTGTAGAFKGRRIVRGREKECSRFYAKQPSPDAGKEG